LLLIDQIWYLLNTITSWNKWFNEKDQYPHWCDAKRGIGINEICKPAKESRASIDARRISRGMKIRPIRALTLGFPNVGKSALINWIAKKRVVDSARKAGVTRNLRWIKLDSGIDLLDAPGVIPPNLENQKSALNLALCDDIGEAAYEIESVAIGFIKINKRVLSVIIDNILSGSNFKSLFSVKSYGTEVEPV